MAVTLTLTGKTPGQTQFGLDTFTEHYKCDATANVVLTDGSVPAMGSAHPDYPFMFMTARYCSETGESASALDLTYTGVFGGTASIVTINDPGTSYSIGDYLEITSGGEQALMIVGSVDGGGAIVTFNVVYNNFTADQTALAAVSLTGGGSDATFDVAANALVLPPQKATSGGQIASVSTNTDADIFPATTTNPLTLNYYSVTNTLSFYSTDPADASEPADPPDVETTDFVSWDLGFGGQPAGSFPALEAYWLASALVQRIVEPPPDIEEVVAGQFYFITKRKTRTLFPYAPPS